ncbi:MAG: glycosyltransferase [bacterium]
MKILQINKFFWPRDGATNYFLAVREQLKQHGHEVVDFSMAHPNNLPSPYRQYFVSQVDFNQPQSFLKKIKSAGRIIYSLEAKRKLEELIKKEKPDVAHLHNIYHQLSPSILSVLKKYKIPTVMTLHDYKLICPNYLLFTKGRACERCRGRKYYNAAIHKCVKNSFWRSLIVVLEAYLRPYKKIDCFIAPSRFMKNKCVEFGVPENKIRYFWHFFDTKQNRSHCEPAEGGRRNPPQSKPSDYSGDYYLPRRQAGVAHPLRQLAEGGVAPHNDILAPGNYLLYFGRLSKEKGIDVLLKAIADKNVKLKIVGAGPVNPPVGGENVEWLGYKTGEELKNLISGALAVVVPSIWYENASASVFEAMALAKPVIASNIGGLPEMIQTSASRRITGLLFKAGDSHDLAEKIKFLIDNPELAKQFGQQAAQWAEKVANPEEHYQELMKIYMGVILERSPAVGGTKR